MRGRQHSNCETFRRAVSALVDGEQPGVDPAALDGHLAACPDCTRYRASVEGLRRQVRIGVADPAPDTAASIARAVAADDRARSIPIVRILLVVVALEVIVLAGVDLFATGADPVVVHGSRHLSAFSISYAVLLLVVAARPARARTALPAACVLAGALVITAVADLAAGRVPLVDEALHLPELLSVALIWLLAVPRPAPRRPRDRPAPLRLVERR